MGLRANVDRTSMNALFNKNQWEEMEVEEAPATPMGETFEMFDGSNAIQNQNRRWSSLRQVSFAEQLSIRMFTRDDDYETPLEASMSHLSTPTTSVAARSSQRQNEVDIENALVSVGSKCRILLIIHLLPNPTV
ncbi:hypothetical protein M758_10G164000 [Ceratodon purpureus]|uniref:Uncharacterized protein n=1 Tax=Ceratodon purpureus TaxID=3225 RepID=A0A8T0GP74_CERPU|nr:hypothetical protein KC19_10G168600 [Ceratodon purpureus]KAG0604337.1 hypothetical protein M758_10G164000 [Ceratodon purpureus]